MIMATDAAKTDEQEKQRGIPCPRCGCCHHSTRNTVPLPNGAIRRYRICRHCGKVFPTREDRG